MIKYILIIDNENYIIIEPKERGSVCSIPKIEETVLDDVLDFCKKSNYTYRIKKTIDENDFSEKCVIEVYKVMNNILKLCATQERN